MDENWGYPYWMETSKCISCDSIIHFMDLHVIYPLTIQLSDLKNAVVPPTGPRFFSCDFVSVSDSYGRTAIASAPVNMFAWAPSKGGCLVSGSCADALRLGSNEVPQMDDHM